MAEPAASVDLAAVRDEVSTWLHDNWDQERPLSEWRAMLADSGWGCPAWPLEFFGRGLPQAAASVVSDEFRKLRAVGVPGGSAMGLAAPTILAHAAPELKRRLLRPIITGEHKWCQLFSEPGNGSDLAGLTTSAVRDGDEWIVNGQKVWTTGARTAAYGMLVARTDWDAPKHRGITYFAFPMQQPGVEVRPLQQMNRYASFNEVFLTDARVAHDNILGEPGRGWTVAMTTLAHERGLGRVATPRSTPVGRTATEAAAEAAEYNKTYVWYPQRAGRADLLIPQAKATGRNTDPVMRQKIVKVYSIDRISRWNLERAAAVRAMGRPPGPEGSLAKLFASAVARESAQIHGELVGAHGMIDGPESPLEGIVAEILISVPGQSIAGGTDEIQHNILAERALGLPKEPSVDADVPFRDVRVNLTRKG